jgi:hypothetical protein
MIEIMREWVARERDMVEAFFAKNPTAESCYTSVEQECSNGMIHVRIACGTSVPVPRSRSINHWRRANAEDPKT